MKKKLKRLKMKKKIKTAQNEHHTLTVKKATQLYVIGGVGEAEDDDDRLLFWYAIRKYPTMSREMKRETDTQSLTEYIQKNRPEWTEGEEPPLGYVEFYKTLPEQFGEGSSESASKNKVPGKTTIIVPPTPIENFKEPTGDIKSDTQAVIEIIKRIRQLIWDFPVQGIFTDNAGFQGQQLRDYIGQNLIASSKHMTKKAQQSFKIKPKTVRYISVDTGEVFSSEQAVQNAIQDHVDQQSPMAAAASNNRGGKMKKVIAELLSIADSLDEAGAHAEADEIMTILTELKSEDDVEQVEVEETVGDQTLQAKSVIQTLVRVADSLDAKGATKEAQIADNLLQDMQTALPQAFTPFSQLETPIQEAPASEIEVPAQEEVIVEEPKMTTFDQLEEIIEEEQAEPVVEETPAEPVVEAEPQEPVEPTIEGVVEPEVEHDVLTLEQFQEVIDGMKYRFSQGKQRVQYEKIMEQAERAAEYKRAYEEWLTSAHEMFGDTPIRLDV